MNDSPGSGGDAGYGGDQRPADILAMIQNMLLTMSADMKAELSSVKTDLTRVMSDVQELTKKVAVGPEEGESPEGESPEEESPEIKGEEDQQARESSQELKANVSAVIPSNFFPRLFRPFKTVPGSRFG